MAKIILKTYDLERAWEIKSILEKEYYKHYTVVEMAQTVGTNKTTLNIAFQKITGKPFKQYLNFYRMQKGQELLAYTELPIEIIAKRVGLTRRNFEKQFKRFTDFTPKDWRDEYKNGQIYLQIEN